MGGKRVSAPHIQYRSHNHQPLAGEGARATWDIVFLRSTPPDPEPVDGDAHGLALEWATCRAILSRLIEEQTAHFQRTSE
jgi:hypothetical protein